ncbi:MAG: ATP-binding protein [Cyclobacteriaceae bacterium]
MGFNSVRTNILIRVGILILTIFLFTHLLYNDSIIFTIFVVFILILIQVSLLVSFLDKSNKEVVGFLESIKYDDFSHTYPQRRDNSSLSLLYREFNNVIKKFREIRAEKEAQHHYLKTIVQHVGIGIITFDDEGEVQIINTAAKRLLNLKMIKNIRQLNNLSTQLVDSFWSLKTGGRDLVKIGTDGLDSQLAIYAIELSMRGKDFKLISLQNIQSELEEKEMEAWQNLIRVLTHEIMNSVTPISSLAATVETELNHQLHNELDVNHISNEEVEDLHLAVKTIHRRSKSLIKFVSDFRNMTRITLPKLESVMVKDCLDHVINLLKFEMDEQAIRLDYQVNPADLSFTIDLEQIEQVLINLVKNAIQALADNDEEEKELKITAMIGEHGGVIIKIIDNGSGIEEDAIKKIFIPFFTTKKNGSGIGLSLSKQIMRNHKGSINAHSTLNVGTEFSLRFPVSLTN